MRMNNLSIQPILRHIGGCRIHVIFCIPLIFFGAPSRSIGAELTLDDWNSGDAYIAVNLKCPSNYPGSLTFKIANKYRSYQNIEVFFSEHVKINWLTVTQIVRKEYSIYKWPENWSSHSNLLSAAARRAQTLNKNICSEGKKEIEKYIFLARENVKAIEIGTAPKVDFIAPINNEKK